MSAQFGRRVVLRPLDRVGLPGLARGAPAQRGLADQVGAVAHPRPARRHRGQGRLRGALQRPSARAPAGHRLRVRRLRGRPVRPARSTCPRCSAARSRAPTSATGSTRSWPATATRPRPWWCCAATSFDELHLHRVQIAIIPRNTASRRVVEKLDIREEGIALRYLEINGVWEDHVRYAMTIGGLARAPRAAPDRLGAVARRTCSHPPPGGSSRRCRRPRERR